MKTNHEIADSSLTIPADPFLLSDRYRLFVKYKAYKQDLAEGREVNPDSLIATNPNFYQAYQLAGNEMFKKKDFARAIFYYRQALSKEIATKNEENEIHERINTCQERIK
jgi:tetratricopeptide (TPR) repeat protein